MSQFFGCIALNKSIDVQEVAEKMQQSMSFFKGDGTGIYQTESVFICNKLLHNTPESINTPLICQNERYVLAATCRLDNREELANKLSLNEPSKASDHEYLLAAYSQFQETCVEHLLGDFSFVIWDKQEEKLFMVKDHLGIKPLFYYKDDTILLFSTSITGIKAVDFITFELDKLYIARELKTFEPTFEDTFFEKIKRLKPAHYVNFHTLTGTPNETRYWELSPIDISEFKNEDALYDELRKRFTEAVVCRTRTHKNIGCQLSGGLDSSAIAVLLSRNIDKKRLHTYSFVLSEKTRPFSANGIDEQKTQNIIIDYAALKKQNHHPIEEFHFKDVFEEMELSNQLMGGYSSSDCIWQASLFREAQNHNIGFIMSGFTGDECVSNSGYLYYYDYFNKLSDIISFLKDQPFIAVKKIPAYYLAKLTGTFSRNYRQLQAKRNLLNPSSTYHKQLKKDKEAFKFHSTFKEYLKHLICRPFTNQRAESESAYALPYSMETVYPLADIRLISLIYSLPTYMFKPKPYTRNVFRNLCISILPDSVRLQEKANGAMTLAFAEYWQSSKLEEFKNYSIKNNLDMIDTHKVTTFESERRIHILNSMYNIDYLINRNLNNNY